jgi:FeS assembly SUF system regulator
LNQIGLKWSLIIPEAGLNVLRISKLTDYGTVVLAHLASSDGTVCSAAEVAEATGIAMPTVRKLLKSLARAGLVTSTRGASGGYQLSRPAHEISAASVIDALEGPVSITECSATDSNCDYEDVCNVGNAWQNINVAIRRALEDVNLVDLTRTKTPVPSFNFAGLPVRVETKN